MSDHKNYTSKFPLPDDEVINVENWEKNNENSKENDSAGDSEFDRNLIALIEFHPWIYDKNAQKKLDKDSMDAGWLAIAQSLNSTGILYKKSSKSVILFYNSVFFFCFFIIFGTIIRTFNSAIIGKALLLGTNKKCYQSIKSFVNFGNQ